MLVVIAGLWWLGQLWPSCVTPGVKPGSFPMQPCFVLNNQHGPRCESHKGMLCFMLPSLPLLRAKCCILHCWNAVKMHSLCGRDVASPCCVRCCCYSSRSCHVVMGWACALGTCILPLLYSRECVCAVLVGHQSGAQS